MNTVEQLSTIRTNFRKEVSKEFGLKLFLILLKVEDFYYTPFWENRFKKDATLILGAISELVDRMKFDIVDEDSNLNGMADYCISLNTNMTSNEVNMSHLINIIMHEFGHLQYKLPEFKNIIKYNKKVMGNIKDLLIIKLEGEDFKYFTDHNELRQRIIPIIREMYINKWTPEETYFKSPNLILDDIYNMYSKDYIIYLLKNIL